MLSEKRDGKSHALWYNPSFSCVGNLKILRSQPFAATYIHADKAGSLGACLADGFEDHAACQVVALSSQ